MATLTKSSVHNVRKRKSEPLSSSDLSTPKPTKSARKTLDAFFSPLATVHTTTPTSKGEINRINLNIEQTAVLKMVIEEGKSVFFTGSAGTGKSLLLRAIISSLKKKYAKQPDVVSVTASTGMAASNIGGMTIHAWGAVAPGTQNVDTLISYIRKCKPALQRWKKTKVLIIDEVSMVDGHLFQRLAEIASRLRKKTDAPFGGLQLVITGDFFQLPPVTKNGDPFFAFECEAWKSSIDIDNTVILDKVFRQKDATFVQLLNQLREGVITPEATAIFTSLSRSLRPRGTTNLLSSITSSLDPSQSQSASSSTAPPTPPPAPSQTQSQGLAAIEPTDLFPLRAEVDKANAARLRALRTPTHTFTSRDSGSAAPDKRANLLVSMMVPEKLELKEGAQVMLVKNIESEVGLVNGSVGKVVGFYRIWDVRSSRRGQQHHGESKVVVRSVMVGDDGKPVAPSKESEADNNNKENNTSVKDEKTKKPASSSAAHKPKSKQVDTTLYPLVSFPTMDGASSESLLLLPDEFRIEDNEGTLLARRMQIPLVLAWAMSIHKSQGQTIQKVRVDLGRVFEKGQSYVALSRAASLEGLQVLRFDPKKVAAHPKVVQWHRELGEGMKEKKEMKMKAVAS